NLIFFGVYSCGSISALLNGTIDSCGAPSASAPVLDGIDLVAVYESLKAGDSVVPSENPGTNQYSYTDPDGFKFLFSSQENLNKYTADPTAYPLGAGGYCALAVSGSDPACDYDVCTGPACLDSADTNMIGPDGKLYFFLGKGAKNIFEQDLDGNIAAVADTVEEVEERQGVGCWNNEIFRCQ
ncbi:hypothetical protein TeGR_g11213, partial [Tetraparma gracilis]